MAPPARRVSPARALAAPDADPIAAEPAIPMKSPNVERAITPVEAADASDSGTRFKSEEGNTKAATITTGTVSVEALRGTDGLDFECHAAVIRAQQKKSFIVKSMPWLFGGKRPFFAYGECSRYVVVKGCSCFIYTHKEDAEPLYAILLENVVAEIEDPEHPHPNSVTLSPWTRQMSKEDVVTVLLKRSNGMLLYQVTFDISKENSMGANNFVSTVNGSETIEKGIEKGVFKGAKEQRRECNNEMDASIIDHKGYVFVFIPHLEVVYNGVTSES
eukprot:scaffold46117_cov57-Attheya_sp.AAC.3